MAVGSFNGDAAQDLAVANSGSNTVSVLLGNGNGTFQAASTFSAGVGARSIAVGDVSGDSHQDVAVANFGSDSVRYCWAMAPAPSPRLGPLPPWAHTPSRSPISMATA